MPSVEIDYKTGDAVIENYKYRYADTKHYI